MKEKENNKESYEKIVELLLENHNRATFNKDKLGAYYLNDILEMHLEEDENRVMDCLNYSVDSLKEYPKKGAIYHDIIMNLFMESRGMSVRDLADKHSISVASVYTYKAAAMQIIASIFSVMIKTQGGVLV